MSKILDTIFGSLKEKREWNSIQRRAKALPKEYRVVYDEIKKYIWGNTGVVTINVFKVLIDLFEESAANGKPVLEITGNNVAAFCDELVRGEKTYFEGGREKLNSNVAKKLQK